MPTSPPPAESIGLIDVFGAAASALVVVGTLRAFGARLWLRTFGRYRHAIQKVVKLAANYQVDFFSSILGPPAMKTTARRIPPLTEWIWVDPLFFVQAVTDNEGTIVRWAVTSRDKRFRPTFVVPGTPPITLNETPFSGVDDNAVHEVEGWLAAHQGFYGERLYFGYPGSYQTFFLAISPTGYSEHVFTRQVGSMLSTPGNSLNSAAVTAALSDPDVRKFRAVAPPNTYGEASLAWGGDPFTIGPDHDSVIVLLRPAQSERIRRRQRLARVLRHLPGQPGRRLFP
ncbi:MAG: ETEC_3214 domain-containing protein [Acidimicrobiia bacterium]